ncbi:hypothetical protein E3E12_01575 [Formicincola oecophyllae]|uniref:Uncharacterized protein n=1 Tax=Formicincola oecophyllae TaxID=2558361 RepID=A0A4Y6U6V5_9PROT|nr:hypothetical protein [Formicincola oecophyllae]QDH13102.1 hypothetical protein E3E12_01575 [Formicincola oecophyllae]
MTPKRPTHSKSGKATQATLDKALAQLTQSAGLVAELEKDLVEKAKALSLPRPDARNVLQNHTMTEATIANELGQLRANMQFYRQHLERERQRLEERARYQDHNRGQA